MKNIFFLFSSIGFLGLSAQNFHGRLLDKETSEGIVNAYVFMIDPVDSSVLRCSQTDYDGYFHFSEPAKPLKSNQYLLKIADFYLTDTSFLFKNDSSFRMLEVERLKVVDWVTINYNPSQHYEYTFGMNYNDWVYTAMKSYQDSSLYYHKKMIDEEEHAFDLEYEAWKKEFHRRDSLIKSGHKEMDIGPPPPVFPVFSDIVFVELTVEEAFPVDGWRTFIDELMHVHIINTLVKSHKNFCVEFSLVDYSMEVLSDVQVFDAKGKMVKLPEKVYTDLKNSYPTHWQWGKLNGRIFRNDPKVKYRIQFKHQAI